MLIDFVRANTPSGPQNIVIKRAKTPAEIAKLEREATILASYPHDGIVSRVNTAVPVAGNGLYTLRVEGPSLLDYNRLRGPLLPVQIAGEVAQLCRILSVMHSRGITHGAIDATHVLLRGDGSPVICSWGRTGASPSEDARGLAQLILEQLQPDAASTPSIAPESDDDIRARLVLLEITDEILRRSAEAIPPVADIGQLIETHIPKRQLATVTGQAATELQMSRTPELPPQPDGFFHDPGFTHPIAPNDTATSTPTALAAPPPPGSTTSAVNPFAEPTLPQPASPPPPKHPSPLVPPLPIGNQSPAPPVADQLFAEPSHIRSLGRSLAIGIGVMTPILALILFFGFYRGGTRSPNASSIPTTPSTTTSTPTTTTTTFGPAPSTSLPGVVNGNCLPANDQLEIDYDGDGCPEGTDISIVDDADGVPIKVLSVFKVDASGNRSELARVNGISADDQFTAGDWSGDGFRTPAVWIASTRCVFVYDAWSGEPPRAIFQTNDELRSISNAPLGNGSKDQIIITDDDNIKTPLRVPDAPASPASDLCR